MKFFKTACLLIASTVLAACTPVKQPERKGEFTLAYARHFSVQQEDSTINVTIYWGNGEEANYVFHKAGSDRSATGSLTLPVKYVVCLSSTHTALMERLSATENIVGVTSRHSVFSKHILERINNGQLLEAGSADQVDPEWLVTLHPDLIFQSVVNRPDKRMEQLEQLGFNVLPITAHYEEHPLGRLEWIKLLGVLLGKEALAEQLFATARNRYFTLVDQIQTTAKRPSVMCGYYSKGMWVAPGGKSYFAKLLEDAGADYVWKDDAARGNIQVSFEEAFQQGLQADYLINLQMVYKDKQQVVDEIPDSQHFKSIQQNNVYLNNAQVNDLGKNNYWEQGLLEPDVILNDLAIIFHPELFPEHKLVYLKGD